MHELDFINSQSPNAAITEFVDMFGLDLPEQTIKAIKGFNEDGQQEALQGPSCNGSGVRGDRD
jgi:hypothetical protein